MEILVIVGIAAAIGAGIYFYRKQKVSGGAGIKTDPTNIRPN